MTHIEQRTDTAAALAAANPDDIHVGEAVHESDTGKWKIGDGTTAYNDLPYKGGVDTVAGATGDVVLDVTDISGAAPLASPALTGNPTGPTRATSDNTTSLATTAFVKAVLAALVDGSPALLDTLNELAAALGDDPNFAATTATALGLKAPIASPTFTGDPKAPTPATADDDTSIATTAFVKAVLATGGTDVTYASNLVNQPLSSQDCRASKLGRRVNGTFEFTANAAGAGTLSMPLPYAVTSYMVGKPIGHIFVNDASAGLTAVGVVYVSSTTAAQFLMLDTGGLLSGTSPFATANGDTFVGTFTYQAAA